MVKIVTDSACDIPPQVAEELDIAIAPARILFGRKSYRDGIDLDTQDFYKELQRNKFHPLTTQASPYDFYREFNYIAGTGEEILVITIPPSLSAMKESAEIAARNIDSVRIEIYDAQGVSSYEGLQVIQAAKLARKGYSMDEILRYLDKLQPRTILYAMATTLKYLVRGGRVSVAQAQLGSLLGINPILRVKDSEVGSDNRARGIEKGIEKMVELLKEDYAEDEEIVAVVLNAVNPTGSAALTNRILDEFKVKELYLTKIGATIGANVGPGAVGVAAIPAIGDL